MKKQTPKQKSYAVIGLAIISSLTILNSCSTEAPKTEAQEKIEQPIIEAELNSSKINKTPVLLWDYIRKNSDKVKAVFNASGNNFVFIPNDSYQNETIHVYVGYNENPTMAHRLNFMFITEKADSITNLTYINENGILPSLEPNTFNSTKYITPEYRNNEDTIAWAVAEKRINNWRDSTIRNNWITDQFKINESTAIFLGFVVKGVDFEKGAKHDCYLALKEMNIDGRETYVADLIIVNTITKEIVSLKEAISKSETVNLEDLTTPVPPFGFKIDGFGLYRSLEK